MQWKLHCLLLGEWVGALNIPRMSRVLQVWSPWLSWKYDRQSLMYDGQIGKSEKWKTTSETHPIYFMKKLVQCFCGSWVGWDTLEAFQGNTEALDEDERQVLGIFVCICSCAIRFIPCHLFCSPFQAMSPHWIWLLLTQVPAGDRRKAGYPLQVQPVIHGSSSLQPGLFCFQILPDAISL